MAVFEQFWRVDRIHSFITGQSFSKINIPTKTYPVELPVNLAVWIEILFISICHNTNWDKLHDRFVELTQSPSEPLSPSNLASLTPKQFIILFEDAIDEQRVQANERARMLREVSIGARDILLSPDQKQPFFGTKISLGGNNGFYKWLRRIPAYGEDPLQKKSHVLVHQLLAYGLITVADPQNIHPAVDYHLIRLYARNGRIYPKKTELHERLQGERKVARVEFLNHLRNAVEEAMWHTSNGAHLPIDEINYIEWQIARSFCVRKNPRCDGPFIKEKPIDQSILVAFNNQQECPMKKLCAGAKDIKFRSIIDPVSAKSYY